MFELLSTKAVPLTRRFVAQFASLPTFLGDRSFETPQGRRRIAWLRRLLDEGKFFSPKWATATLGGMTYRVNGGHSSAMLLECDNGVFPAHLNAIVDEFKCETAEDLADLFDQFDPRKSIRTINDRITAHKSVHDELADIAPTPLAKGTAGIAAFYSGFGESERLEEDERIRLIHKHQEFLLWSCRYLGRRALTAVGAVSAMFATWHRDPEDAELFWDAVRDETEPAGSPSRKVASFLKDRFLPHVQKKFDSRATYVKCIHGWNAYRTGQSTDLKYTRTAALPRVR